MTSKGIDCREVVVQAFIEITHPLAHRRLVLESFDSGEECSFFHFMEVMKLVDEGEGSSPQDELEYSSELERAFEETMSEVDPATAYQHFAGNVV
jgi:hypothetical protein